jgi:tetratricopeptide (TPR) repeat protein
MFHIGMWRERMRNSMSELAEGRPATPPPPLEEQDEINDRELAGAIGIPLGDAAARCDHLLGELIDVYSRVGDAPFDWYGAKTTSEAVLRSTCIHATTHMSAYHRENGDVETADAVVERTADNLRDARAPDYVLGIALYNLACVRAQQGRKDEALELLGEALGKRPDAKKTAADDSDLAALRDEPRFKELVGS